MGWHSLNLHFRVFHNLTTMSNYICGQDGCPRDFQSLTAFRRHILAEHFSQSDTPTNHAVCSELSGVNSCDADGAEPDIDQSVIDDLTMGHNVDVDTFFDDNGVCLPAASFVAKLKSHSSIPASAVNDIVHDVQDFFSSECVRILRQKTVCVLQGHNIEMSGDQVQGLMHDFDRLGDMFTGLKTEYQQMKYFQNSGHFIAPETIVVGHRMDSKIQNGATHQVPTNATAQHIRL